MLLFYFFFFFQAEDGIRDLTVTGVQTCALPISRAEVAKCASPLGGRAGRARRRRPRQHSASGGARTLAREPSASRAPSRTRRRRSLRKERRPGRDGRSEERRVGEECRSRWSPD